MATKKDNIRLFCIDNKVVLIQKNEIIKEISNIDEERLKEKIIKQINKGVDSPTDIFSFAMHELIGIKFKGKAYKFKGKGIQDSSYYHRFLNWMLQTEEFKKRIRIQQEQREGYQNYIKTKGLAQIYRKDLMTSIMDKKAMHQKRKREKGYNLNI